MARVTVAGDTAGTTEVTIAGISAVGAATTVISGATTVVGAVTTVAIAGTSATTVAVTR